ncbi:MAG: hypothetical protein P9M06_04970 [Candidatus Saelkia tenebricola]|nr:hypothetical protein [Candidatus Saelkia tenebricola]
MGNLKTKGIILFIIGATLFSFSADARRAKNILHNGELTIFYSYHFNGHDFEALREQLETKIKSAQEARSKILFINEFAGPDIRALSTVTSRMGLSLQKVLTDHKHRSFLKEFFQTQVEAHNRTYESIGRGGSIFKDENFSSSEGFDRKLVDLLTQYRVETVLEQVSFESWRIYMLAEFYNTNYQTMIADGNIEGALKNLRKFLKNEAQSILLRDGEFMDFISSQVGPNTTILSDRGLLHNGNMIPRSTDSYTISEVSAHSLINTPAYTILLDDLGENRLSIADKEELMYKEIISHFAFLLLHNYRQDLPCNEMMRLAKEISDIWGKKEAIEIAAELRHIEPENLFPFLHEMIHSDSRIDPGTAREFIIQDNE